MSTKGVPDLNVVHILLLIVFYSVVFLTYLFNISLIRGCSHRNRQVYFYTYMFFIRLATGAYKEHISIMSRVSPCRFPCEQALRQNPPLSPSSYSPKKTQFMMMTSVILFLVLRRTCDLVIKIIH